MEATKFLKEATEYLYKLLQERCPVDTGNMKASISLLSGKGGTEYVIEIPANLVPYVVYTNERWISPKWNGRQNPNYHWIDDTIQLFLVSFTKELMKKTGRKQIGIKFDSRETRARESNTDWNSSHYEGRLGGETYSSNPLKRWYDKEGAL